VHGPIPGLTSFNLIPYLNYKLDLNTLWVTGTATDVEIVGVMNEMINAAMFMQGDDMK